MQDPVAADHDVRVLEEVLGVDGPEGPLAPAEDNGDEVHRHVVGQAHRQRSAPDVAGRHGDDPVA